MKLRALVTLTLALMLGLGASPARALDETCSIDGGSAGALHLEDPAGDGVTEETDPAANAHDVTDVLGGWFERAEDGTVTANISVAELTGTENNTVYYFQWVWAGNEPLKASRWLSAHPRVYGAVYQFGYLDTNTPGLPTFAIEGTTTGSITTGAPGRISIAVPFAQMGNPKPGDELSALTMESRLLIGHPGPPAGILPPGAPNVPRGVVQRIDDTSNGDSCDSLTV